MRQSGVTIIAQAQETLASVTERLAQLGQAMDVGANGEVSLLRERERIHFFSFFAFEAPSGGDTTSMEPTSTATFIVLEVSGDGSARQIRNLLADHAPRLLSEVFRTCTHGANDLQPRQWKSFLRKHDAGEGAFYLANPGRSVSQVRREASLRKAASRELLADQREVTATELWKRAQAALANHQERKRWPRLLPFWMRWGLHPKGAQRRVRALGGWCMRLLQVTLYLAGLASAYAVIRGAALANQILLALAPPLIVLSIMVPIWRQERPLRAKRSAWLPFAWRWLRTTSLLFVALGVLALIRQLSNVPLEALTPYEGPALSLSAAVGGALTLVLAGIFAGVVAGRIFACTLLLGTVAFWIEWNLEHWLQPLQLLRDWAVMSAVTFVLAALYTVIFLYLIRRKELTDPEPSIEFDLPRLQRNTDREDRVLHNHLATVTELRPGKLRVYALRVVLRAVAILARVYFNQGDLDSIVSIHFARFVIHSHNGRHRLLFMGNYDGGFSAYLGAFSTVPGTTAVWSNTQGFPRTFGLLFDGACDEQRFKAFGRRSQAQTLGWFSAYPTLSTQDVHAGTLTHLDLNRTPQAHGAQPWFELWRALKSCRPAVIAAQIQAPFDETACDAAVRRL